MTMQATVSKKRVVKVRPELRWKTILSLPGIVVLYQGDWSKDHRMMLQKMLDYFDYLESVDAAAAPPAPESAAS